MEREIDCRAIIARICFHLDRASRAYERYKEYRTFIHAKCIRNANGEIARLVSRYGPSFDGDIRNSMLMLLCHLDVWITQFDFEVQLKNPSLDTSFVFYPLEGHVPFPQDAVASLYDYLQNPRRN